MTLNLSLPGQDDLQPRITVFGVGGAGGNAVNNMIDKELDGVDFVVANTDAQALRQSHAPTKIQMGVKVTEGLGAGARPTVGAAAAEESIEQIVDHLAGAHMCFITAGMGGGTGTGAAPIIAQAARRMGVLTVGVVTKPFQFEGSRRMRQAEEGIDALQKVVDTLIIIPNQNLFRLANEQTTCQQAFALADDVLYQGVKGITDLMVRPGMINLDFADVRSVMDEMGKAMMGTGEAEGEDRAVHAAEKAIANPLLDEISLKGAKGVLINITGGYDLTLFELDEAANRIKEQVDDDANIIVGSTLDPDMSGRIRVSVVATGIDAEASHAETPLPRRSMAQPLRDRVSAEELRTNAQSLAASPGPAPQPVSRAPLPQQAPRAAAPQPMRQAAAPAPQPAPPAAEPRAAFEPEEVESPLGADDLPPPAYRPRGAAPQAAAPQAGAPAAPGTPTPEALARLRTMMERANGARAAQGATDRPADPRQAPAAAPAPAERPRFGINSIIKTMTGAAPAEGPPAAPTRRPDARPDGRPEARPEPRGDSPAPAGEQDRSEIPAFLRRQAN